MQLTWRCGIVVLHLCLLQLCCSLSASAPKRTPGAVPSSPAINKRLTAKSNWADIELEINNYLEFKTAGAAATSSRDMDEIGSYNNPLAMFIPSGWYKDNEAIDLRRRSDKRLPTEFHPLSYIELRALGYEHLIEIIIELGGPIVVGEKLGITFVEPKREYKEDESLRPVRSESFALDMRGSLQLGQSLDDKLEAASQLNLDEIKARIAAKQNNAMRPEELEKLLDDLRGGNQ